MKTNLLIYYHLIWSERLEMHGKGRRGKKTIGDWGETVLSLPQSTHFFNRFVFAAVCEHL